LQARSYRKRFSHNWFLSIWFGAFRPHVSLSHLACLLAFALAPLISAQNTIHVPGDQPTIQAGINAANNGDTVLVAPATYNENINFNGKAITVTSSAGAATTIIDGGNTPGVATVLFTNNETNSSVISNLTIRGGGDSIGTGTSWGGIYAANASPTIQGNTITANYCDNITVQFGTATILNNELSGLLQSNLQLGPDASYCTFPGAISLGGATASSGLGTTVIGNTIENNLTGSSINMWDAPNVLIMNNIIRKNATPNPGSAVLSANSEGTVIAQNLIYSNTSACGGAIALEDAGVASSPQAFVANNTFANNVMSSPLYAATNCTNIAQIYPGPYTDGSSGPGFVVVNNIISGSTSYPAVNCSSVDTPSAANQPTFENNILRNTGGPFFGSYCIDVSNQDNNITSDPQFVSSSGNNYQLEATSPAINAGQNSVLQTFQAMTGLSWTKDFNGTPRLQGTGCTIDMGAYEYPGTDSDCATSETLTSSLNPAMAGQTVTFTAQLSAGSGTPTGSIQFLDGTTVLSTQTVSGSGSASFSTTTLAIGTHAITANYQPTGNFGSATASLSQVINGYTTASTLVSSLNPSNLGQPVTFTATVTSSNSAPSGTVQFLDGSNAMGTVTLVNGSATWTTSTLTAGQHTIQAVYRASGSELASTASLTQTVNGLPTATTLTASPNPAYAFQSVTLAAKVTTTTTGAPTGTVTFYDSGTSLGTANLATNGIATLPVTFAVASATPHQLTATYNGDATFNSSTSSTWPETIQFNPSTTLITTMVPNTVDSFGSATLSATVSSSTSPVHTPTGSITFTAGGKPLGSGTLANGTVSVLIIAPAPGSYPVIANYSGDTAFFPSASPPQTLNVIPDVVSITLISSENPSIFGDSVTFTASIVTALTVTASGPPLTGTFTFFDGTTQLGKPVQASTTGTATYTTATLAVATHPITAVFSGNADVAGATSPVTDQVVQAYPGTFTLSITPDNAAIYTGAETFFNITATPENGFNLPLGLTCSSLPANTACVFGPARIVANPPPGSEFYLPYASTLTIKTVAPSPKTSAASLKARWTGGAAALACLCGILIVPRRVRRALRMRLVLIGVILIGVFAAISGCSGGGTLTGGTPPGTYQINITAQTPGGGPQLSQVVSIKLVVKSLF
jgi:hypothetical protein